MECVRLESIRNIGTQTNPTSEQLTFKIYKKKAYQIVQHTILQWETKLRLMLFIIAIVHVQSRSFGVGLSARINDVYYFFYSNSMRCGQCFSIVNSCFGCHSNSNCQEFQRYRQTSTEQTNKQQTEQKKMGPKWANHVKALFRPLNINNTPYQNDVWLCFLSKQTQ